MGKGEWLSPEQISVLAEAVQRCSSGEQAQLRRMTIDALQPPIFWKLLLEHVPDAWNSPEHEAAWTVILQGMSLQALSGPVHDVGCSLGTVLGRLSEGGTEARFIRLLQAPGRVFFDLLRHMLRFLARKRLAVDWHGLAWLCLAPNEEKRLERCRQLAREFYAARSHHEGESA